MRKAGFWLMAALFVAGVCGVGLCDGPAKDEEEIRALEDRFVAAFRAKDVDAIMKG